MLGSTVWLLMSVRSTTCAGCCCFYLVPWFPRRKEMKPMYASHTPKKRYASHMWRGRASARPARFVGNPAPGSQPTLARPIGFATTPSYGVPSRGMSCGVRFHRVIPSCFVRCKYLEAAPTPDGSNSFQGDFQFFEY